MPDRSESESLAPDQIHESSRSGDDDLSGALQSGHLAVDRVAAGEHLDEDFFGELGIMEEMFADLFGEFAGGGDDEGLNLLGCRIDFGQQGEAERSGFAGSCLGLCDEVAAIFHQEGDGSFLDLGWLDDPELMDGLDQGGWDSKFFESFRHGGGE